MKIKSLILFLLFLRVSVSGMGEITPNDFKGSDTKRIQSAIDSASKTTHQVVIPSFNNSGKDFWEIEEAILIPGNMTIILNNCTLQLSDSSRDNMFRSDNLITGSTGIPEWNRNIRLIGIGNPVLKGAKNPRSTGDALRIQSLDPDRESYWRVSYGSDAGKTGRKQKGDWRNIMILMAYVDSINIENITLKNAHAWAMSFERTQNAMLSDIHIESPEEQLVNGKIIKIHNRDGIDILKGCKHFHLNNISGVTEDDFIALSNLGTGQKDHKTGDLNSTMITDAGWHGTEDDIEDITINNVHCKTNTRAVAIRATDSSGIRDIDIKNVTCKAKANTFLIGGAGYGKPSLPARISHITAMNFSGNGESLLLIESPIADCVFMNGIYTGTGSEITKYNLNGKTVKNIKEVNLIRLLP